MHQKFKVSFMCTFMFIKLFAYGCKTFASHQGQTQPIQPNFDHYHNIFNRHIDVHLYTRFLFCMHYDIIAGNLFKCCCRASTECRVAISD